MTATDIVPTVLGILLCVLPFLPQVWVPLQRMLRRGYPGSSVERIVRGGFGHALGRCTIVDALVLMLPATLLVALILQPEPLGVAAGLGLVLLALALFDLRYRWLPDVLTLPLLPVGLALAALQGNSRNDDSVDALTLSLLGMLGAGGLVWIVGQAFRLRRGFDGIGGGDVKLIAGIGAWLGPHGAALTIGVAACAALALELASQLARSGRIDEQRRIPFGAYLSAAFWVVWCMQPYL